MRSFIVSVLGVAIFFVGVTALINDVSAKFSTDAKALELIKKSRQAIGGDSAIDAVKSMTIVGELSHLRASNGEKKAGEIEINFELPGKFAKTIKIGEPGEGNDANKIKRIETVVVSGDDSGDIDIESDGHNKKTFVFKSDGKPGDDVDVKEEKIIIEKKDGTIEEIKPDGDVRVFKTKKDGDGKQIWTSEDGKTVVVEDMAKSNGDKNVWTSKDGNVITVDKIGKGDMQFEFVRGQRQNEFLKTTIALLLTAPEGSDANYKFVGEGNVDGKASNIIEVESKGATFKLFLDASTNLPQMISFREKHHEFVFTEKDKDGNNSKKKIMEMKIDRSDVKEVERQIKFSNFSKVGKLNLPHRWVETIDGKPEQTIDFKSFTINPSNIADKFKNEKVFVRKMKTDKNN